MSDKKRPKELDYIGKVPKPGDSVWNIQKGYALEHIITDVYPMEGFFVCSVRYPHEKQSIRFFDTADMYICKQWFLSREDAEDALDEKEKYNGTTLYKNPECARPKLNSFHCYQCPYSYAPDGFNKGCIIHNEKWKLRPKKPVFQENTADCPDTAPYCPVCGHILMDGNNDHFNYCPDCGQKINWKETQ